MDPNSPLLPLILMIPVFYFLILRPKQKEMKKADEMRKALKKGDEVLTISGIYGIVQNITDERITLKVHDNTRIDFTRDAITKVVEKKTK